MHDGDLSEYTVQKVFITDQNDVSLPLPLPPLGRPRQLTSPSPPTIQI